MTLIKPSTYRVQIVYNVGSKTLIKETMYIINLINCFMRSQCELNNALPSAHILHFYVRHVHGFNQNILAFLSETQQSPDTC